MQTFFDMEVRARCVVIPWAEHMKDGCQLRAVWREVGETTRIEERVGTVCSSGDAGPHVLTFRSITIDQTNKITQPLKYIIILQCDCNCFLVRLPGVFIWKRRPRQRNRRKPDDNSDGRRPPPRQRRHGAEYVPSRHQHRLVLGKRKSGGGSAASNSAACPYSMGYKVAIGYTPSACSPPPSLVSSQQHSHGNMPGGGVTWPRGCKHVHITVGLLGGQQVTASIADEANSVAYAGDLSSESGDDDLSKALTLFHSANKQGCCLCDCDDGELSLFLCLQSVTHSSPLPLLEVHSTAHRDSPRPSVDPHSASKSPTQSSGMALECTLWPSVRACPMAELSDPPTALEAYLSICKASPIFELLSRWTDPVVVVTVIGDCQLSSLQLHDSITKLQRSQKTPADACSGGRSTDASASGLVHHLTADTIASEKTALCASFEVLPSLLVVQLTFSGVATDKPGSGTSAEAGRLLLAAVLTSNITVMTTANGRTPAHAQAWLADMLGASSEDGHGFDRLCPCEAGHLVILDGTTASARPHDKDTGSVPAGVAAAVQQGCGDEWLHPELQHWFCRADIHSDVQQLAPLTSYGTFEDGRDFHHHLATVMVSASMLHVAMPSVFSPGQALPDYVDVLAVFSDVSSRLEDATGWCDMAGSTTGDDTTADERELNSGDENDLHPANEVVAEVAVAASLCRTAHGDLSCAGESSTYRAESEPEDAGSELDVAGCSTPLAADGNWTLMKLIAEATCHHNTLRQHITVIRCVLKFLALDNQKPHTPTTTAESLLPQLVMDELDRSLNATGGFLQELLVDMCDSPALLMACRTLAQLKLSPRAWSLCSEIASLQADEAGGKCAEHQSPCLLLANHYGACNCVAAAGHSQLPSPVGAAAAAAADGSSSVAGLHGAQHGECWTDDGAGEDAPDCSTPALPIQVRGRTPSALDLSGTTQGESGGYSASQADGVDPAVLLVTSPTSECTGKSTISGQGATAAVALSQQKGAAVVSPRYPGYESDTDDDDDDDGAVEKDRRNGSKVRHGQRPHSPPNNTSNRHRYTMQRQCSSDGDPISSDTVGSDDSDGDGMDDAESLPPALEQVKQHLRDRFMSDAVTKFRSFVDTDEGIQIEVCDIRANLVELNSSEAVLKIEHNTFATLREDAKVIMSQDHQPRAIKLDTIFRAQIGTSERKRTRKVLTISNAGSGKTAIFMHKSPFEHSEGTLWPQLDFLFPFELRNPEVQCAGDWKSLVSLHLKPSDISDEIIERTVQFIEGNYSRVGVILDGLDECCLGECSPFMRNLLQSPPDGLYLVVTSRPCDDAVKLKLSKQYDRFVEVVGLSKSDVKAYVQRALGSKEEASKLLDQIAENPVMDSLMTSPVVTALVCELAKTQNSPPESATSLFQGFVSSLTARFKERLLDGGDAGADKRTEQATRKLRQFALHMLSKKKPVFTKEDLERHQLSADALDIGLLVRCSLVSGGQQYQRRFSHLMVQEFMAAQYAAEMVMRKQITATELVANLGTKHGHLLTFWKFVTALLPSGEANEALMSILMSSTNKEAGGRPNWEFLCDDEVLNDTCAEFYKKLDEEELRSLVALFGSDPAEHAATEDVQQRSSNEADTDIRLSLKQSLEQWTRREPDHTVAKINSLLSTVKPSIAVKCDLSGSAASAAKAQEPTDEIAQNWVTSTVEDRRTISRDLVVLMCRCFHEHVLCNPGGNCHFTAMFYLLRYVGFDLALKTLKLPDLRAMSSALQHHPDALRIIDLSLCGIEDRGLKQLLPGLLQCTELTEVHLSDNTLTAEHLYSLSQMLRNNAATLQCFSIARNCLRNDGLACLKAGLRTCTQLTGLWLNETGLRSSCVDLLSSILKHFPNLQTLWLKNNDLADESVVKLQRVLARAGSLQVINFASMQLTSGALPALTHVIRSNPGLREIRLDEQNSFETSSPHAEADFIAAVAQSSCKYLAMPGKTKIHKEFFKALCRARGPERTVVFRKGMLGFP
eukprot:scpid6424/ scgid4909/ Nucleotide-binding oligomerization domain-containing protein 2; Caspase recruitment domain-containing protein 15